MGDEEKTLKSLQAEIERRKAAEAQLRDSLEKERDAGRAKFQALFEGAPQAIVAVDAQGRIALVNRGAEEMFQYSRTELLGQQLSVLIPQRLRATHSWHWSEYIRQPRTRQMGRAGLELTGLRKDETEFPAEVGLSYVETPEGILVLSIVNDITNRKRTADELRRANAELSKSAAQLRSFLEAASQAILAISHEGKIVLVNQRTEEMFGYSREELIGRDLEVLLPERYRRMHAGYRAGYFAEPRVRAMGAGMTLAGRRKDGSEFPVEIGLSFVEGADGVMALGLVSDITERKQNTDRLAQVNEELRRSNLELEQFAYVASHDLQEPLRMISSYLQLLARRYRGKLDTDADEFIQYAVDGAERMKMLILDLLNFSRAGTQTANFHAVPAQGIVDKVLINLKTAIEESQAAITVDTLPTIVADSGLLGQVFQNLIGNAIKFQKGAQPQIHVGAAQQGSSWVFSVRDNGIGIDATHIERIFQIFQRLHGSDQYSGTGIGLAISKKIVERHGGRIWVESHPGKGSTFFFSIPAESETKERLRTMAHSPH